MDLWTVAPGALREQPPVVMASSGPQPMQAGSAAISPAGQGDMRLAWVQAGATSGDGNGQHLYLVGGPDIPTPLELTPQGQSAISAPAWSADGRQLAAVLTLGTNPGESNPVTTSQLAIFDGGGDLTQTVYIHVDGIKFVGPLAWAPTAGGGRRIAALVSGQPFSGATSYGLALAMIDLNGAGPDQAVIVYQPVEGLTPELVTGMAWSQAENGIERVAVLGSLEEAGMVYPRVVTLSADASRDALLSRQGWFAEYALAPGAFMPNDQLTAIGLDHGNHLRWRPGTQQFSLVVNENNRARVVLYSARGGPAETLLTWDEPVYMHAWSPDGQWLAVAGESGVWLVSLAAPDALPLRLISVGGWDLDWR
jgi:hypothetical protein